MSEVVIDSRLKWIRLVNYQSIEELKLEFSQHGVFHLIGANNIGKSAILKAVAHLFGNVSRNAYKEFIRDDCDTFMIEGMTHDGSYLCLSRGKNDYYEYKLVTGEQGRLDKTDGKMPSEVVRYLNLYIDEEKTEQNLNLRLADDIKLFVQTSDMDNYHLLQKALRTEEFLVAMKLAGKKKREIGAQLNSVRTFYEREKSKLDDLRNEVKNSERDIRDLERVGQTIDAEYKQLVAIEKLVITSKEIADATRQYEELAKKSVSDKELREVHSELLLLKLLQATGKTNSELKQLRKRSKELESELEEIQLDELKDSLKTLRLVEKVIKDTKELEELERKQAELQDVVLFDKSEIEEELKVLAMLEEQMTLGTEIKDLEEKAELVEEEFVQADNDLADFMRENNFCPIVAKRIDKKCPFHNSVA